MKQKWFFLGLRGRSVLSTEAITRSTSSVVSTDYQAVAFLKADALDAYIVPSAYKPCKTCLLPMCPTGMPLVHTHVDKMRNKMCRLCYADAGRGRTEMTTRETMLALLQLHS